MTSRRRYALVHVLGDPWFERPGIAVMGAGRGYLMTDGRDVLDLVDEDIDDIDVSLYIPTTPDGELLFSEKLVTT